jgi:hypothetical protein
MARSFDSDLIDYVGRKAAEQAWVEDRPRGLDSPTDDHEDMRVLRANFSVACAPTGTESAPRGPETSFDR